MSDFKIKQIDAVNLKVDCEKGFAKELSEYFTFMVPNYQYTPAYKNKYWDGKIRLFNIFNRTIYAGLSSHIKKFCEDRNYPYVLDLHKEEKQSCDDIDTFLSKLNISNGKDPITLHDHQVKAIREALLNRRCLLLSPTGSGKSLIIYCLLRYYLSCFPEDKKFLVIVPTTGLASQMKSDFLEYSANDNSFTEEDIHMIFSGKEKQTKRRVVVSTWQSLYKMPESYFEDVAGVFGDECHLYKAKSLVELLTKMKNAYVRIGTTGTLDNTKTHKLMIEGLFGPTIKVTSTVKLMEKKILSKLKISCITLKYDEKDRNEIKRAKYQEEVDWLVSSEKRNKFIIDLATKLKGNTLVLFNFVEKHGKPLYESLRDASDNPVYFIHGNKDVEEREMIRKIIDKEDNSILVASYGTCSTGINIKNIHNIIFAFPSKSVIRVLQSIGRGLRTSSTKDIAKLYDIGDDLQYKSFKNHTLKHLEERIKIYTNEGFNYESIAIPIRGE
jgi:superfamily II DNA or RNA helicase